MTFDSGTLNVSAIRPRGILAWVDGNGSATVTTGAGTVINVSGTQFGGPGVYVFSSGTATAPNELRANVASQITSVGPAIHRFSSNRPVGIRANNSGTAAPIFVNLHRSGHYNRGRERHRHPCASGSGSIIVDASGPITRRTAHNAVGIRADSGGLLTTGTVQVNATNVPLRDSSAPRSSRPAAVT